MKKIPTLFMRDTNYKKGVPALITREMNPECSWVFDGEGVATRKHDGVSCYIKNGRMFRRQQLDKNQAHPYGSILVGYDQNTKKGIYWVPVNFDDPNDKWHIEVFSSDLDDGTYELVGPKINRNNDKHKKHKLIKHSESEVYTIDRRDFDSLYDWLSVIEIEGIVFHHFDGRMAKIKRTDFGLKWG